METTSKLTSVLPAPSYGTVKDVEPTTDKQRPDDVSAVTIAGCRCCQLRLLLYAMIFLAGSISYALRVSLSQALVAMVNRTSYNASTVDTDELCPRDQLRNTTFDDVVQGGEFDWDRHAQGAVLAAFYYGYALIQVHCKRCSVHFMPSREVNSRIGPTARISEIRYKTTTRNTLEIHSTVYNLIEHT